MQTLHLHRGEDDRDFPGESEPQATRLWLSDQQWLAILGRIERKAQQAAPSPPPPSPAAPALGELAEDPAALMSWNRSEPRHPLDTRCMLRVGTHGPSSGIYLVRTRNLSSGGLGFVHNQEMVVGARCTVALETDDGSGVIVAARVAWCRELIQLEVEAALFEVGVRFDRPIDLDPFGHVA